MGDTRAARGMRILLYGAMAAVTIVWIVRPFIDPDFFWHLKTGEWIWQHRELPARDPFTFTNQALDPSATRFTLRAYWLSQLVYHAFHAPWGIPGILALKLLVAMALILAMLKVRAGDPLVHAALVLAVLPLLFGVYPFERPQVFSFLFYAVLLLLLERVRTAGAASSRWASYLPVPLLMLAWSNMHGGHAVGQVTIALFLVLEGAKFAHPFLRPLGHDRYRRLLVAGLAGLGASLVNPNAWHALGQAFLVTTGAMGNAEYLPTVRVFQSTGQPLLYVFWGALVLATLAVLFSAAKPDITYLALLAGTGAAGYHYLRYVPFFLITAVPVVAALLSRERVGKWAPLALGAAALALAGWLSRGQLPTGGRLVAALEVNEAQYPVRAADFVIANDLRGNLYNTWAWGGYLIWRLAPGRQVFVDGRGLDPSANFLASAIALALPQPAGSPLHWKNALSRHGVGHLVIPTRRGYFHDGARGLRAALLTAPEWVPVFADGTALVYALNTPEHRQVIARHAIPSEHLPPGD